jgi:hypothetical protein
VTVVVDLVTLLGAQGAPAARLDWLGVVCGEAARRLVCDAGVCRVLTNGSSQILDAGRSTRTVTLAQRRALVVRDGGCVGCRAPVGWCEAHHVIYWLDFGPTDLDNLVLLCWGCHRDVHERGWHPIRGPDGHWRVHPPSEIRQWAVAGLLQMSRPSRVRCETSNAYRAVA